MKSSHSVSSKKSGVRRSTASFQADPPLDRQAEDISSLFGSICGIVSQSCQKSDKRELKRTFNSTARSISDSIHKLFCDTWRGIRASQKGGDETSELHLKEMMLGQFDDFKKSVEALRKEQIKLLVQLVQSKIEPLEDEIFLNTTKLLNDLITLFCQDLEEILNKCREIRDSHFYDMIHSCLIENLGLLAKGLSEFHFRLITSFDELVEPQFDEDDMVIDQIIDGFYDYLEKNQQRFLQAAQLFHDQQKQLFDFAFKLFQNFYSQIYNDDENHDEEGFDVEIIFNLTIDIFINLCSKLSEELNNREENPDDEQEANWAKARKDEYLKFLKSEVSIEGDTLAYYLNQFWKFAAERSKADENAQISNQFEIIGGLLYETIEKRFNTPDPTLKATDVSLPFLTAVQYNADNYIQFRDLLITQVEQCGASLENLRRRQLKILSEPPKEDENLDFYISDAKDLSKEIQSIALDLNAALFQGRDACFILSQRPLPIQDDDDYSDNYESENPDDRDVFLLYDNEESAAIKNHLDAIIDLNKSIYSSVSVPFSPGMSPKKRKQASDSASVYSLAASSTSRKSKKSTTSMTRAIMAKIADHMNEQTRAQTHIVEDAMASTYLQLFSSIKGTLIAAIRLSEYQDAAKINQRMHQQCLEYLNHLNETKKRANKDLDIEMLKDTDQRIQEMQAQSTNDLEYCIIESLRNLIDMTISNYERNIENISDKYYDLIENERKNLQTNASKMSTDIHIPQLVLLEKERLIALKKENNRMPPQFQAYEDRIRQYAAKGEYARAKTEKRNLENAREADLNKRLDDVNKVYDTKKSNLILEQQKELNNLEENFKNKKKKIKLDREVEYKEQGNTLASSLRSSVQRHSQFAIKILPLDPQAKRDLPAKFERIVNEIIINRATDYNFLGSVFPNVITKKNKNV